MILRRMFMEKTKKNKKSKKAARLRRRIGMFVVAGLSLVLTVSMAVGSTLAWFAGSTWASKDLYLGGPVYLEMSGADGDFKKSGAGNLDITVSGRSSGTNDNYNGTATSTTNRNNVMLPGQRVNIASYARIFSTGTTDSIADDTIVNDGSGSNPENAGNSTGTASFQNNKGRVTTSTTSVLRARYSLNIEFDPSTGYNNFTSQAYQDNYPVQHQTTWEYELPTFSSVTVVENKDYVSAATEITDYTPDDDYSKALNGTAFNTIQIPCVTKVATEAAAEELTDATDGTYKEYPYFKGADDKWYIFAQSDTDPVTCYMAANVGRRDNVATTGAYTKDVVSVYSYTAGTGVKVTTDATAKLTGMNGNTKLTSIYKWKYVSKAEYLNYGTYETGHVGDIKYWKPGKANMLGSIGISDATGTTLVANNYAVFILLDSTGKEVPMGYTAPDSDAVTYAESDAFYKARCNAYLTSYDEVYVNEYGNLVKRNISTSLAALESSLNGQFTTLINKSSAKIQASTDGGLGWNAQWMYIDPLAGNDTNSGEISTQVGGWFYLVAVNDSATDTDYYTGWTEAVVKAKTSGDPAVTQYYYVETAAAAAVDDGDEPAAGATEIKLYSKFYGASSSSNVLNMNMVANGTAKIKYKDVNGDGALDEGEYYTVGQKASTTTTNADGSQTVTNNYFARLSNLLYEIIPNAGADTTVSYSNGSDDIVKVFSKSIPFVNGAFTIPQDEITNIFSNAKISVQVSFQAVQAFLPYTQAIDGITDGDEDDRLGAEKALTIQNSIYVFNEAFDYSEGGNTFDDSLL